MITGEPPSTRNPSPAFQFTLRQLFGAMGIASVFAATFYWLGPAFGILSVVPGASIAFAIYFRTKRRFNEAVFALLFGGIVTFFLFPIVQYNRPPRSIRDCSNNLHNLAIALQNYHDDFGAFPPAYVADEQGNPMHSWRVLLLPYIEQQGLYSKYRFDEPWNGPNNIALAMLIKRMPIFECPRSTRFGDTSYLAVAGPQTMWPGASSTRVSDINDGTSNTIMLVEVHNSGVHWMEPRDLDVSQLPMAINPSQGQGISSLHKGGANVAFVDGRIQQLDNPMPAGTLRALLTIAGGENIGNY